ncbi:MAG: TAXI family TRAP transporter solute-binding subunit [Oleiphilaceae bacterium]|nr:TAXI family TRAP transporter solute-binding subunit [Oleiphilaceae bacterium]
MLKPQSYIFALMIFVLSLVWGPAQAVEGDFIIIGTGGVTGVYYPTGGSICRMVNRERSKHGIRCAVESTQGSVNNIELLRKREIDMAVVQADIQDHAYKGSEEFKDAGPHSELRALFSLHSELFTLVARKDSGIASLSDLKGKRVNIGNPGSGQRAIMERLMASLGWQYTTFLKTFEYKSSEQSRALCRDRFDAMVFVVGHPSGSIKEATVDCDSAIIDVAGPAVDKLVDQHAYYRHATIPGNMYRGNEQDIKTFGLAATFVATDRVSEEVAYHVVKAVFEDLETFSRLHPAFYGLKREDMIRNDLSAPIHPGALKYYKEAGLME